MYYDQIARTNDGYAIVSVMDKEQADKISSGLHGNYFVHVQYASGAGVLDGWDDEEAAYAAAARWLAQYNSED